MSTMVTDNMKYCRHPTCLKRSRLFLGPSIPKISPTFIHTCSSKPADRNTNQRTTKLRQKHNQVQPGWRR